MCCLYEVSFPFFLKTKCMESLKRLYFSLAAGFAVLTKPKEEIIPGDEGAVSHRVSMDVDHYRTHFFNL